MNNIKKDYNEMLARVKNLESERDRAVEALQLGQEGWATSDKSMRGQLSELNERLRDLDKQNNLLHEQLQELGLKVAVVQSQVSSISWGSDNLE